MQLIITNPLVNSNIDVKVFTFSGGEVHVKINADVALGLCSAYDKNVIHVIQDIRSAADLMAVVMVKDALDELFRFNSNVDIRLVSLYVPYARQDRYCEEGEAFGVKAFARILNSLNFNRVIVADPHSDVTPALINNLMVISQEVIAVHMLGWKLRMEDFMLVSPDGGALKKIFKLATPMALDVVCAEKIRDTRTGKVVRTEVPRQDFEGRNVMIVDDICDGGRTFIELAKVLRQRNVGKVELYVTHGIFSNGMDELMSYFDCIHSFNVWENNVDLKTEAWNNTVLVRNQKEVQEQILGLKLEKGE
ncbi:ribose-phosphate pyrophosphokinase [Citrobacter phage Tr1]|nr:ribose-phosphate pyrophosphokinase [Citrobacter phage Tr1]